MRNGEAREIDESTLENPGPWNAFLPVFLSPPGSGASERLRVQNLNSSWNRNAFVNARWIHEICAPVTNRRGSCVVGTQSGARCIAGKHAIAGSPDRTANTLAN